MKHQTTHRFAATTVKLAAELGLSRSRVYELRALPDFPAKTAKGWPIEAAAAFVEARRADDEAASGNPMLDALRAEKIKSEIALNIERLAVAKAERAEVEGRAVPLHEYNAALLELGQMFVGALCEVERGIEALTRDASILTHVRHIIDGCKTRLRAELV
ncbi:MAG: hypothetical protein NTY53_18600 [Kiritimatiellaeota bacterium]|nr:hypothetical protein [Kiritimatiellota bacterium]